MAYQLLWSTLGESIAFASLLKSGKQHSDWDSSLLPLELSLGRLLNTVIEFGSWVMNPAPFTIIGGFKFENLHSHFVGGKQEDYVYIIDVDYDAPGFLF